MEVLKVNNINNFSIVDLLPPSISSDSTIINACKCIDQELHKVSGYIEKLNILNNIDNLDDSILDVLAYQFDVPYYDSDLTIEKKRELVKGSISWHKKKGTVGAVEEIVSIVFGESKVEEWYKYNGNPHHFRIITTNIEVDDSFISKFKEAVEHIKRKSSWLDEVIVIIASQLSIYTGFVVHTASTTIIRQEG